MQILLTKFLTESLDWLFSKPCAVRYRVDATSRLNCHFSIHSKINGSPDGAFCYIHHIAPRLDFLTSSTLYSTKNPQPGSVLQNDWENIFYCYNNNNNSIQLRDLDWYPTKHYQQHCLKVLGCNNNSVAIRVCWSVFSCINTHTHAT